MEAWPELREIAGDRFSSIPPDELEAAFVDAFRGVVPNDKRFLGGETIGELFDRVLPPSTASSPTTDWDTALVVAHGAVNRAILSHALTGERMFLGHFEQAPGCLNVLDVGRASGSCARSTSSRPTSRTARRAHDDDGAVLGGVRPAPGARAAPIPRRNARDEGESSPALSPRHASSGRAATWPSPCRT